MRIDPKSTICGVNAITLRDFFQRVVQPWNSGDLASHLSLSPKDASGVVDRLISEGWAEVSRTGDKGRFYCNTVKGNRLANASAAAPLKRATAKRAVEAFLSRVHELNENDYFVYRVTKVLLFGSFLSDSDYVNDVDLALALVPKHDPDRQGELENQRISEAHDNGRTFHNIVEMRSWPQEEALRFLKSRSRTLSLHRIDDAILSQTKTVVIYETE